MAERKSVHQGLTTGGHGPDDHGLGAVASPEDPRDLAIADHPRVRRRPRDDLPVGVARAQHAADLQPGDNADARRVQQRQRSGPDGPPRIGAVPDLRSVEVLRRDRPRPEGAYVRSAPELQPAGRRSA